jgi:hypothetical protein
LLSRLKVNNKPLTLQSGGGGGGDFKTAYCIGILITLLVCQNKEGELTKHFLGHFFVIQRSDINHLHQGWYAEIKDQSSSSILHLFFSVKIEDWSQARTVHTKPGLVCLALAQDQSLIFTGKNRSKSELQDWSCVSAYQPWALNLPRCIYKSDSQNLFMCSKVLDCFVPLFEYNQIIRPFKCPLDYYVRNTRLVFYSEQLWSSFFSFFRRKDIHSTNDINN